MSVSQEIELASIPDENVLAGMTADELEKSIREDEANQVEVENDDPNEGSGGSIEEDQEVTEEETADTEESTEEEPTEEAPVTKIDPAIQQILAQNQLLIQEFANEKKQKNTPLPETPLTKEEFLEKLAEDGPSFLDSYIEKKIGPNQAALKKFEEQNIWNTYMQNENFAKLAPTIKELESVYEKQGLQFKDVPTKMETLYRVAHSLAVEKASQNGKAKVKSDAIKKAQAKKVASGLPMGSKAAPGKPAKAFEDLSLDDMAKELKKLGLGGDVL